MPVPTNQSFATAIDIGTLTGYVPYTVAQDAWDGAQTVPDLFYSYLPVAGDDMLEVFGHGDIATYNVQITIWAGPLGAETQISQTAVSTPMQQDIVTNVPTGARVFFKAHKITGNANPSILHLRIARGQKEAIAQGDLCINDSSPGYPLVVMDPATAIPKRYLLNFPAGEGLQILQNGILSAIDAFDAGGPVTFNSDLTLRNTPTMPASGYTESLASNQVDQFIAFKNGAGATHGSFVPYDADGVVGTPVDVGSVGLKTLTPNRGYTKVYFAKDISTANQAVFVINIGTLVVTTFKAGVAGKFFGANLMMMTNDLILIPYEEVGVDTLIRIYNEAGVEQSSSPITLTGVQNALERIFPASDDPTHFWVWWQTATLNRFQKIKVSDGSVVTDLSRMKFVEGISEEGQVTATTVYSGADFSCVPGILRASTPPPTVVHRRIRRLRTFPLPFDRQFWVYIRRLEFLIEAGVGLANDDGTDPMLEVRVSSDGGTTWGNIIFIPMGKRGEYKLRQVLNNIGRVQNGYIEIVDSDPVRSDLMACFVDAEENET